jgi:hypothetical protein
VHSPLYLDSLVCVGISCGRFTHNVHTSVRTSRCRCQQEGILLLWHLSPLQNGLSRTQLDAALLVAEGEAVEGLPPPPAPLLPRAQCGERPGFVLRRVESTARAHQELRAEAEARLALLQARR